MLLLFFIFTGYSQSGLMCYIIYQQAYSFEEKLFADIDDYVLLWYNSIRPHSFNNGLTP